MTVALHAMMLLGGVVGLWCLQPQGRVTASILIGRWVPMLAMVAAMADMAIGYRLFPQLLWCLILLLLIPLPFAGEERFGSMALHRSLAVLTMFALMTIALRQPAASAGLSSFTSHSHGSVGDSGTLWVIVAGCVAFVVYSTVIAAEARGHRGRPGSLRGSVEAASSGLAVAAMTVSVLW